MSTAYRASVGAVLATRLLVVSMLQLAGCGGTARLPLEAGMGPNPQIPPPEKSLLPIPDLRRALANLKHLDPLLDIENAVYFAARDLIVRKPGHAALSHWRLPLFAFLFRNAVKVVDRFNLPSRNVVEIARKIEV
jgi:hypothetical protein